jgi:penicillin amidase
MSLPLEKVSSAPETPVLPLPAPHRPRRFPVRMLAISALVLAALSGTGGLWMRSRLLASLPAMDGHLAVAGLSAPIRIERDSSGIPTVRGADRRDVALATGFLHAQDRFFQMDLLRRRAAGELAEIFGETALDEDRRMRVHRLRRVAAHAADALPDADRQILEAYTSGVNQGLGALAQAPFEHTLLGIEPAPWKPEDSLLALLAMFAELQSSSWQRESALGLLHDRLPARLAAFLVPPGTEWDAPLLGPAFSSLPIVGPEVIDLRRVRGQASAEARPLELASPAAVPGSNSCALAGRLTADGGALVANDLHLDLAVPNLWYRMSLIWPSGTESAPAHRVAGITLPGLPFTIIGSNGRVAWGLTNLEADTADLVEIEPAPGDPELYLTPQGTRKLQRVRERIVVKGRKAEVVEIATTLWGPLLDRDHRGRSRALAWVAHQPGAVDLRFLGLETARTPEKALEIASRSGMPALNILVAGSDGRIGWSIAGRLPRRVGRAGDRPASWARGETGWRGWLPPGEYPRAIDPSSGRLWTANNRPAGAAVLAKLGDGGYAFGARARQIRDGLSLLREATPRDLLGVLLDDRAVFLEHWRDLLLQTLTPAAVAGHAGRREIREQVAGSWDGRASVGSAGYRIVRDFRQAVLIRAFRPLIAPCKEADPQLRFPSQQSEGPLWRLLQERPPHLLSPEHPTWDALLLSAVDLVLDQYRSGETLPLGATWGEVNQTHIRHPLSRGVPLLGRWLDLPSARLPGDDHMPRVQQPHFGASVRMVVSPGREHRGILHMPGGQSGHPLSSHYRDGQRAWEEGEATPFLPGPARHSLSLVPQS